MLNFIVTVAFLSALGVGAYSILSLWEGRQRTRLLQLARAAYPEGGEPDVTYWGNDSLLLLYGDQGVAVGAAGSVAKAMPAGSILAITLRPGTSGGTSSLSLRLDDVARPEMTLVFPGDLASQAEASLSTLLARAEQAAPETEEGEEEEEGGGVAGTGLVDGQFIDTSADAEEKTVIMDPAPPSEDTEEQERQKGQTVIIDELGSRREG